MKYDNASFLKFLNKKTRLKWKRWNSNSVFVAFGAMVIKFEFRFLRLLEEDLFYFCIIKKSYQNGFLFKVRG